MKKVTPIFLAAIFILNTAIVHASVSVEKDSIVTVTGKVVDKEGNAPLKAVVEYKRLPYGSEIGKISSNDNGEFTIYVHSDGSYSISVSSDGYFAHYEEFNVSLELSNSPSITREIALEAGAEGYVFTLENLIFELGQSQITESSHNELDMVVSRLKEYPAMEIQLEGHTDYIGTEPANDQLGEGRAEAVKKYLMRIWDIDPSRILMRSFGERQPIATNESEDGRSQNRRAVIYRVMFSTLEQSLSRGQK